MFSFSQKFYNYCALKKIMFFVFFKNKFPPSEKKTLANSLFRALAPVSVLPVAWRRCLSPGFPAFRPANWLCRGIRMPDYGRIMFPEHDVRPNGVRNFHDLLKSHGPHCLNHFLQVRENTPFPMCMYVRSLCVCGSPEGLRIFSYCVLFCLGYIFLHCHRRFNSVICVFHSYACESDTCLYRNRVCTEKFHGPIAKGIPCNYTC